MWYTDLRDKICAMSAGLPLAASNSLQILARVYSSGLEPRGVCKVDNDCISIWFLRGDDQATIDCYEDLGGGDEVVVGIRIGRSTPPRVLCLSVPLQEIELETAIGDLKARFGETAT